MTVAAGANCPRRHRKMVLCPNYLVGFCIDGPNCKFGQCAATCATTQLTNGSPRWEIPKENVINAHPNNLTNVVCH